MQRYTIIVESTKAAHDILPDPEGAWVRFEDVEKELGTKCARCGKFTKDIKTLYMDYDYEMSKFNAPFRTHAGPDLLDSNEKIYTLKVCKSCRAAWVKAIVDWFEVHSFRPFKKGEQR